MGLLDIFNSDEGRMGLGLLAAGGARSDGAGFGQRLQEAMGGVDAWKQSQQKQKMLEMQAKQAQFEMDKAQRAQADDEAMRSAATNSYRSPEMANAMSQGPVMGGGAVPQVQSGLNMPAFLEKMYAINPLKAQALEQSMQPKYETLAAGSSMVKMTPQGPQVVLSTPKEKAAPAAVQEYEYAKGQGYGGSFEQWNTSQKRAGATNISNKIENKMGESIANQVGPMLKDSYTAANGAVQQVDAAKRIIQAVDSGKIISGPGANARMTISQIGQTLGIGGRDDAEIIANTRQVIRGLSEMTLQGRKQMSGQGAITESEGVLAEKANSGRIEDLTPAEIKQLAKASARASNFIYKQHQQNLDNLSSEPSTAGLAKFYKPMALPAFDSGQPEKAAGNAKFLGFE